MSNPLLTVPQRVVIAANDVRSVVRVLLDGHTHHPAAGAHEDGGVLTLGAALTATEGYGAPEVARTYARAWELCTQVGETPQVLPVLRGVGRFYVIRGELSTARDVGMHLLTMG